MVQQGIVSHCIGVGPVIEGLCSENHDQEQHGSHRQESGWINLTFMADKHDSITVANTQRRTMLVIARSVRTALRSCQRIPTLLENEIRRALSGLTARESRIVELRYGLRDGQPLTLQDVAERFGLTRERIRQIEKEALAKLRQPNHAGRLIGFVN